MPWSNDGTSSFNAAKCVPVVPDPAEPGDPCTSFDGIYSGLDDCDEASMCFFVNPDTLSGSCFALCSGSPQEPECPDSCDTCLLSANTLVNLCLSVCDPLLQDCPTGMTCYDEAGHLACLPTIFVEPGPTPCETSLGCAPGWSCTPPEQVPGCEVDSGCCTPFCSLAEPDPCNGVVPGTVCTPWSGAHPEGCVRPEVGLCTSP